MKWATNKRLHFELGVIKAIQVLSEVRITDVIKVLTKGADHISQPETKKETAPERVSAKARPTPEPTPPKEKPAPEAKHQTNPEPKPTPPAATPLPQERKKPSDTMSAFDEMIANAPDEADEPDEPEPIKAAAAATGGETGSRHRR